MKQGWNKAKRSHLRLFRSDITDEFRAICKIGKNKGYKAKNRRLWSKGKLYKVIEQTLITDDKMYMVHTNDGDQRLIDEEEFKKRFRRFV